MVNAAVRPVADEAEFVAVEEPGGDLLDGGVSILIFDWEGGGTDGEKFQGTTVKLQ